MNARLRQVSWDTPIRSFIVGRAALVYHVDAGAVEQGLKHVPETGKAACFHFNVWPFSFPEVLYELPFRHYLAWTTVERDRL